MLLEKKTALITGAARGIGAAIARLFAAEGADLVLWDLAPLDEISLELKQTGRHIWTDKVDISDLGAVEEAVKRLDPEPGRLDVLVNNAGVTRDNLLFRMKAEEWDLVLKINLYGAFNCTKVLGRLMARKGGGSIINLASVIGLRGNPGQANYGASKAGLIGFTKSSARELARFGIRVNALAPGYIQTPMTDRLTEEQREAIRKLIPMEVFGKPEDVAEVALFFASRLSGYVTGEVLRIDGGFAM
ncbi:MAG TPA: 3-oxoacyl-ACP reductase FabG [bacterium]|uniref:3-oxoacyl-(Acyl-carrier-protein) reductase FabG n=1 Tax=candidate division TA06 bacterium ADurb.Bin417 TaxID=1852828 RepID=A0A1V5MKB5_UNCT6|nr:MAG: 3-oxoacyl-(acyl-carrier-protein) reductase FabG [candidate division TA06 bacterium ADurb.Bin417]HNQ35006.1 3-oxoacyl-ACP reductase FabG [bacterium]HNS48553.1 3-oxoacyl-ACP reductase FabG [bacterium]